MDSVVPERSLAHANLLRVRGELAEAKQALLIFLAERPNDPGALDLLARTCEDAGEAEEARRWRGLAGAPHGMEPPATVSAAPSFPSWAVPAVLGLGLAVIGLGFAIGRSSATRSEASIIGGRVEAPGTTANPVGPSSPPLRETAGSGIASTDPLPGSPGDSRAESSAEANGLTRLTSAEGAAGRALSVTNDPRTHTVTVTFAPRAGESARREAAALARTAFGTFSTARTLQMRALRGRELVYLATAHRERLLAVETEDWVRENGADPDALADALLTDEWNPSESSDGKATGAP